MSLDVYLTMPGKTKKTDAIFIREHGQTKEISRAEWDAKFPGREPVTVSTESEETEVFTANVTHNLSDMAKAAGIYCHLWSPNEIGITKAAQLVQPLTDGLALLQSEPDRFKVFNAPNGWGIYDDFVPWVANYLAACMKYPGAKVSVWT